MKSDPPAMYNGESRSRDRTICAGSNPAGTTKDMMNTEVLDKYNL